MSDRYEYHTCRFTSVDIDDGQVEAYVNQVAKQGFRLHTFDPTHDGGVLIALERFVAADEAEDIDLNESPAAEGIAMKG